MGRPFDQTPHTLAQLARRAGISEGRARALAAASPSGLPRPDRTDADGRPLWWAATIDAWCSRTNREVSGDSLWLFRAPAVDSPVPELVRGMQRLGRHARPQDCYVIVWDTDHGHLVYLQPLGDRGGDHKDWLAVHAAEVIEPRWWADAVVVMPLDRDLNFFPDHRDDVPKADVYRLTTRSTADDGAITVGRTAGITAADDGVFGGLRRWLARATADATGPARPKAEWAGLVDVADIAAVVGRPIPVWIDDTDITGNAEQTLTYDRTFTTTDTVTEWPAAQARLERALEVNLPSEYPTGFAALATDAAEGLVRIRAAHDATPSTGNGWYLVCRPARPAPSIELEQYITSARLVTDTDLVGKELTELRAVEGELDVDDPRGEVYAEVITLLEWQLRRAAKQAGQIRDSGEYVPVADDGLLPYSAPWTGPVVDAWRKTLKPVKDLDAVLRLRRVRRILRTLPLDAVRRAYRDREGRYVLVTYHNGIEWSLAEWPVSLTATAHWTDDTVLAGDDDSSVTTLMALTPTGEGGMRIDPVPLSPRSDRDAFAYGYGGGTPGTTYQALLRIALDDEPGSQRITSVLHEHHPDGSLVSQLWEAISTTTGPLRLSWPQLRLWARADRKAAGRTA